MRVFASAALAGLMVAGASAQDVTNGQDTPVGECHSSRFGGAGRPTFKRYEAPNSLSGAFDAGEPTIGIPWNTDSVFFQAFAQTLRIKFDKNDEATWDNVTPFNSITNVDPMLYANEDTGRVYAGGLAGPCSVMAYTDDDGLSWFPTGNMCSGAQFDHQTVGSGPYSTAIVPNTGVGNPVYPNPTYYCAQLVYTVCATSLDGGVTWTELAEVLGGCGGIHGHVKVSRVTGTAAAPDVSCGATTPLMSTNAGFFFTNDNGLTWSSRLVEGAPSKAGINDPSLAFTRNSGWLYYGFAGDDGAFMALSKDEGVTWEKIGGGMGVEPSTWFNVGQFYEGGAIVTGVWADVDAGDDDRAAFSFVALIDQDGDGTAGEYPNQFQCDDRQEEMVWYYFVAMTYDAGETWTVELMAENAVQIGGIADNGTTSGPCRNLLDFQDMDIDSQGRVYIGFGDGCIDGCEDLRFPQGAGFRTTYAVVARQHTGKGLFSEFDLVEGQGGPVGNCTDLAFSQPAGFTPARALRADEITTCASSCGTDSDARAPSGCSCSPECASSGAFALDCCQDYSAYCTPYASSDVTQGLEVTVTLGGPRAVDAWSYRGRLSDKLAEAYGVGYDRVKVYSQDAETRAITAVVFPTEGTPAQALEAALDVPALAARFPSIMHSMELTAFETRVVQFADVEEAEEADQEPTATTAQQGAAAAASASADGTHPAVYAVPAALGSLVLGGAAGYLYKSRAANNDLENLKSRSAQV